MTQINNKDSFFADIHTEASVFVSSFPKRPKGVLYESKTRVQGYRKRLDRRRDDRGIGVQTK